MSYRLAILASPSPAFVHSAAPGARMAGQSLTRNSVTATYILAATGRNGCKVHASTLQHLMVKLNGPNGIPLRYGFWNYKYNTVSLKCRWLYMQLSHTSARCYILISGCGMFMPLCRLHEVHWCVACFDLGAQEPHGFQLFQALLPALLMESSTSGVAQLEQMRQEALRYWHEVQWFSDQPVNLWIQIGAVGNYKKTKKNGNFSRPAITGVHIPAEKRWDKTWISQAAPHGVAGVAISESPFPWQIHCEDMGVARMHGRLRLCRYKITMIRLWW